MSSRMTSGIGANKWDDPTITSIGCGQQLRDSRWGTQDPVPRPGPANKNNYPQEAPKGYIVLVRRP